MSDPQAAISELIEKGYTEQRIADEIRASEALTVAQSSIHRIKVGTQKPRFDVGVAILKVRDRLIGQAGSGQADQSVRTP